MFRRKYKCIRYSATKLNFTVGYSYINYSWDSSYFRFRNDFGCLVSLHDMDSFKLNDLKDTLKKL